MEGFMSRKNNLCSAKPIELIETLIQATGLPPSLIEKELFTLLDKENLAAQTLEMDQLRAVLAKYLRSVIHSAKNSTVESI